jgi:uncharacterized membrane protein YoaK (UPF0700 family)
MTFSQTPTPAPTPNDLKLSSNWPALIIIALYASVWLFSFLWLLLARLPAKDTHAGATYRGKSLFGSTIAFCAGFINANTGTRFKTFGGYLSGRTVNAGMAIANNKWYGGPGDNSAVYNLAWVLSFSIGSWIAWLVLPNRKKGSFHMLSGIVLASYLLLEILVLCTDSNEWISILSPFAEGIMCVISVGEIGQPITFMTGRVMNGMRGVATITRGLHKGEDITGKLRFDTYMIAVVYFSFMIGAIPGVWATRLRGEGEWTLLIPASIYFISVSIVEHVAVRELRQAEGQAGVAEASEVDVELGKIESLKGRAESRDETPTPAYVEQRELSSSRLSWFVDSSSNQLDRWID